MGVEFFQTVMGQRFYEGTMPMLAKAAKGIAEGLAAQREKGEAITSALTRQNELLEHQNGLLEHQNKILVEIGKVLEERERG